MKLILARMLAIGEMCLGSFGLDANVIKARATVTSLQPSRYGVKSNRTTFQSPDLDMP